MSRRFEYPQMVDKLVLVVLAACGSSPATPARATHAESCRTAFRDYQKAWRAALDEEVADIGSDLGPLLADGMTVTVLTREELAKMRTLAAMGDVRGSGDSPAWVAAWATAERAIDLCGENAKPE